MQGKGLGRCWLLRKERDSPCVSLALPRLRCKIIETITDAFMFFC